MASIIKIGNSWRAQIRKAGRKSISKTFPTKAQAIRWGYEMEGGAKAQSRLTVAEVIASYREQRELSGRPISKRTNTHHMLENLSNDEFGLGQLRVEKLETDDLIQYCRRRLRTIQPSTANMEMTQLGTVLRHTKGMLELQIGDIVGDARPALHHYGLIGASNMRTRRPTAAELEAIYKEIDARPRMKHMRAILTVALHTGMRRGEILRIRWLDLDDTRRTVIIRDRKDPKQKIGNDQEIPLLGASWDVIQAQPRKANEPRIFPYNPSTVSNNFTQICKKLGITGLVLHDMRHELTSTLFESGWQIPEVAVVTGHKSWTQLKRYTQIEPTSLHDKPIAFRKTS